MKIILYLVTLNHSVTGEFVANIGIYSTNEAARAVAQQEVTSRPELTSEIGAFELDYYTSEALRPAITTPSYMIDAIQALSVNSTLDEAITAAMQKSVHKIVQCVKDCMDNPKVLQEYIQGLDDGTEDYL